MALRFLIVAFTYNFFKFFSNFKNMIFFFKELFNNFKIVSSFPYT